MSAEGFSKLQTLDSLISWECMNAKVVFQEIYLYTKLYSKLFLFLYVNALNYQKNLMRKILTYTDFHFIEDNGWGLETLNNIALFHSTQVHIIPNLGLQYDIYGSRTPLFFFPWMSIFPSCYLSLFCHFINEFWKWSMSWASQLLQLQRTLKILGKDPMNTGTKSNHILVLVGANIFNQETQITWKQTASGINTMILCSCSFWATAGTTHWVNPSRSQRKLWCSRTSQRLKAEVKKEMGEEETVAV